MLADQLPTSEMPPSTDHGDVPNFSFPFAAANKRVQNGGWARQVTVNELPIAKSLAGVDMRLTAGGVRELHWHLPAEWAFVLYGNARITGFDQNGRSFVADVSAGDLWNFPSGIPHSIQGLEPDGTEFLLVFDDGKFSEFDTFLPTTWMAHTPVEVLPKNFTLPEMGGVDILVNNAAHQATFKSIEDITDDEWELTFRTNIHSMFYLTKAAVLHMKKGGAIINTASINADAPNPTPLAYATTKGAIQNFTAGLAQLLAEKGIRANAVAPGPIWTPLIPSTMPEDAVAKFGNNVPMKRPGQPAELATAYVMLADPLSSYVSGATIAVIGGKPIL